MITDFYTILYDDGTTDQVSLEVGKQVARLIEEDIVKTTWFEDVAGSETFIRLEHVQSMYRTNPAIRRAVKEHNKAMRQEDPSWEA